MERIRKRITIKIMIGVLLVTMGILWIPNTTSTVLAAVSDNKTSSDSTEEESSGSRDTYSSATSTSSYILPAGTWLTPEASYGQYVYVTLPILNMFKYNIKDVIITPVVSTNTSEWPFEIEATGYTQKLDVLVGEEAAPNITDRVKNVTWAFKTRDDVLNGYYKIDYNVLYTNPACEVESCTISTFVKTIGKAGAGSTDGADSESGNISTPRVIVSGFSTNPKEVFAGDTFTLTLGIENTSKRTPVSNVEFTLDAAVEGKDDNTYSAFLPTSGSNTIYIDKIGAGQSTQISIDLTAKADLVQKPYVMNIKMAYEDMKYKEFENTSSVSIPVKQVSKFETSTPEIMPDTIEVGAETNVMFSIYNTGKTKLYNVAVRFEGSSIEGGDAFIGPLESGATGNVDVMLTGKAVTTDDGIIHAIISYENESGVVTEEKKEMTLYVNEPSAVEEDMMPEEDMGTENKENKFLPILIGIIVLVVVVIIVVISILKARSKKRKENKELNDLEQELIDEQSEE